LFNQPVPLDRFFSPVPKTEADSDEHELFLIRSGRKRTDWSELEKEFRIVILAEAGAGKSHEMEARAKHAEECGRAAFFIRIEDIEDGFESAFEVGTAESFECWLSSREKAWFYLDSIDEARLDNPRKFEKAIRHFATRIKGAQQRAHIVISSRPYAWRAYSDRNLLERYLPFKKPKSEETGGEDILAEETTESDNALSVYFLDPLTEEEIRFFAEHRGASNVDRLILDLQRADLMSMAGRPFDLDGILAKWESDQALDGRLELLQHNIDLRLGEIDPTRAQRRPLSRDEARTGARILAAAVILTGEPGIRVPDKIHAGKGIDAEAVLEDWDPVKVQALLERGIFNDALYGLVRFRHREVRELLAAEWFNEHRKNGISRFAVDALFFREQYGHEVITPRLRPVLPWLILFDAEIRRRAIGIAPEVVVEGGDAAHLPLMERQALLENIVGRIVNNEDERSARDNSAIARIAQADLTDDALRLITRHQDNDDALFFLGRLVWQGEMSECVPALSQIAANPERGIYARIVAARSVMTCGAQGQRAELWQKLLESHEKLPRRLFLEIIENADPDANSVSLLLASIDKLEARDRFEAIGLNWAIHGFIDRLPLHITTSGADPMKQVVNGLDSFLEQEPYIKRRECHVSEEFMWLLGPAIHAVERLVLSRSKDALEPEALTIMLKMPLARFWRGDDFDEYKNRLHELVPAWSELNDALFWRSVEDARARLETKRSERLIDDWPVQWVGHYWRFGPERFRDVLEFVEKRAFEDDKLVALSMAYRLFAQSNTPSEWLSALRMTVRGHSALEERLYALLNPTIPQSDLEYQEEEKKWSKKREEEEAERAQNRAQWIERLKANPDVVRDPPGLKAGEITNDQLWLLVRIEDSGSQTRHRDGADWGALRTEFGEEVAHAYRDAAVTHWRNFTPGLRSDGDDTSSTPYSLIFGMAGLEIEAREVEGFPGYLSEAEVRHALRYLVWELNGFPSWLETMFRAHPDLVLKAVLTELYWELAHTDPDKPKHYILHDLVYYAPWLHSSLAAPLLDWMEGHEISNQEVLRYCIHIVISGDADSERLARLAQFKIKIGGSVEQLAAWYALWVDVDADNAILGLDVWLSSQDAGTASQAAQLFITKLVGGRQSEMLGGGYGSFRSIGCLKSLYVIMCRYIRAKDDIERAGMGVYSPELRDGAQDARNALFDQLSKMPGKQTYVALAELMRDHPESRYRPWMGRLAYKRAEEDADLEPWSAQQVREFDVHQARTPATHRQLFDLTVGRLNDLRAWLERGNDSPYKTWQRVEGETEMRNLVAGWLNGQSSGRYSCAQENELPNRQRPDIWTQHSRVPSPIPIELKLLDKGWSGPDLCERLRNQLAGDYLREETAGCGVMLLIWQGRSAQSHWQIGDGRVPLADLGEALKTYWNSVAGEFPGVASIDVIVIDLTVRDAKSEG